MKRKYIAYIATSAEERDKPLVFGYNHMLVTAGSIKMVYLRARQLCRLYNTRPTSTQVAVRSDGAWLYPYKDFRAADIKGKDEKTIIGFVGKNIPIFLYCEEIE